jgi:hypothetical protein
VGQGKVKRNEVITRNEETGQTHTRKVEELAGTSEEDAIRKSSQATFILPTDRKT